MRGLAGGRGAALAGAALGMFVAALASPAPAQFPRRGPAPKAKVSIKDQIKAQMRNVRVDKGLEYTHPAGRPLLLDLYRPPTARGRLPVIVWIHGGAWRAGSRDKPQAAVLALRGYAVASIGYRFSQDAVFPAQIVDCKSAVRWVRAHADEYGLDPDRVGVWGSSAGGHLAALVGVAGDVTEWDRGEHLDQSSRVGAVCDFYGPTDLTLKIPGSLGPGPIVQLLGGTPREKSELARAASPVTHVTKDDPPFFIVHGTLDELVPIDQSRRLHERLKSAGVKSTFLAVGKAGHGFDTQSVPPVGAILLQVAAFFDQNLGTARTSAR